MLPLIVLLVNIINVAVVHLKKMRYVKIYRIFFADSSPFLDVWNVGE